MNKVYFANDAFDQSIVGVRIVSETDDVTMFPLKHHVHHSPDGFSWGYEGSGPSELARCILWDLLGREPAPLAYQEFKRAFIAPLDPQKGWEIKEEAIREWIISRGWTRDQMVVRDAEHV